MPNGGVVVQLSITDCTQCPYYGTFADPDPNKWDWFRDGHRYGFCSKTMNDRCNHDSPLASDRSKFKPLFTQQKLVDVKTVSVPEWCPMRSKKA